MKIFTHIFECVSMARRGEKTKAFWEIEYLSDEQLKGFDSYKYSCVDTSPFSNYIMHPFWNQVVKLCPIWVAPNVLTFGGFVITTICYFLLSYYDPDFKASSRDIPEVPPVPSWVFFCISIGTFVAYTLDGIDGKQARRTQTSSPIGELFDHGIDSWSTVLIPIMLYSIFGRSEYSLTTFRTLFVLWNTFINFYLSHWEKYNTGVLFLPWAYDFTMMAMISLFFNTWLFGYETWKFTVGFNISAAGALEILLYTVALFANIPFITYSVYISYKLKTGRMLPLNESLEPLYPLATVFFISTLWVCLGNPSAIETHPRLVYLLVGTLFSNISCRLIVAQMSNSRSEAFNYLIIPLILVVLTNLINHNSTLLMPITVFTILAHVHYGACVVRQMCRHFDVECFTIRKKQD